VDEAQQALMKAGLPVLVRAGQLVEPLWTKYPTAKDSEVKVTALKRINASSLKYMLNKRAADFAKYDARKDDWVAVDPPNDLLQTLLDLGHWPFPQVSGIINAPTLRPDGSILDGERHLDRKTRLWFEPDENLKLPAIPKRPTKADAEAALKKLRGLLVDFPFVGDVDRAVALSAILTAVLRGAFTLAPMFLFSAHEAGTGKSFLVDLISTIVRGRPCPVITASPSKEEMEKRLGALLLEGVPIFSIDNCSINLEGDLLCQFTTQQTVKTRVLGKSEMPECESRATGLASGNNVGFVGDMTRRGLTCHLDAGVERPELRSFKANPIKTVLAGRADFIAACLTIGRAYVLNRPKIKCDPFGSFEEWSRFAREPLIWLGEADPVKSTETARLEDPERIQARALAVEWKTHLTIGKAYRVSEIIAEATKMDGLGPAHPDLNDLLLTKCSAPNRREVDPYRVGKWLERIKGQVHGGWRLEIGQQSASHGNRWRIVAVTPDAKRDPKVKADLGAVAKAEKGRAFIKKQVSKRKKRR
jgi:putative DNA primase/helicase